MENKAQKLLESLTPGGSEFANDPEYCVKYVKEFEVDQHKKIMSLIAEKNRLVESKNELLEALKMCIELFDKNEPNWYLLKHDRKIKEAIKKATA